MQIKQQLRMIIKEKLVAMSQAEKMTADEKIYNKIIGLVQIKKARVVSVYVSMRTEVDTKKIISFLLKQKKRVVVPGIRIKQHELRVKQKTSMGGNNIRLVEVSFVDGNETVKQWNNRTIDPKDVDLFIVPGLAFDKQGHRLGRGGGYYDRLLAGVKGVKIGLAYSCQMTDKLLHLEHDVGMDFVVTDQDLICG